jgi:tRNA nucleotidyltransferase (CCA-adding enzyme)
MLNAASAPGLLQLFKRADAFRRPERFAQFLQAAHQRRPGLSTAHIEKALAAAARVDAGAIAGAAPSPAEIPSLIDKAREQAIAAGLAA